MTTSDAPAPATVLAVDDSEGTRLVFSNWLRRAGHAVHEASTGAEALELLGRIRFDLVLLDVHLPDMTGFELCERIKSSRATSTTPVLYISATATSADDRTRGLNQGGDGYLIEPVERDELLANVAALLRYNEARRSSERLAGRLELLHHTTLLVNAAPNVPELIDLAATGLVGIFGRPGVVMVSRGGHGRLALASPNDIEPVLASCSPAMILTVAEAARSGDALKPEILESLLSTAAPATARGSAIETPRGELIGAVVVFGEELVSEDEMMLDHLSQALAVAIENQRLYDVEHQIALTLQHAMLPQSLPEPTGLEVAVRYHAASDTVEIGGDFYEVIQLDGDRVLLVIGDIGGHSLRAATVMAELRYSLRAFLSLGLPADQVVSRLGSILTESHPDRIATLCLVEIDPGADEIRITNAGHVPPLVRRGDDASYVLGHGPLLGLPDSRPFPTVCVPFRPGDLLVLTTDGLVERRDENLDVGLDRLRRAVLGGGSTPGGIDSLDELCERILDQVIGDAAMLDDIAIVAARRTH